MNERFARAVAHSMVGSALGRRSHIIWNRQVLFANLYLGLIAKPGSGKSQVMKFALAIIDRVNDFSDNKTAGTFINVGNDSVSKASLVNDMVALKSNVGSIPGQPMITMHEMTRFDDELSVFMPVYEPDKVGLLLKWYDNPRRYKETRVTADPRELENLYFNWIFGTQPDTWSRLLAMESDTGLKSRTILCSSDVDIYAQQLIQDGGDTYLTASDKVTDGGFSDPRHADTVLRLARDLAIIANQMFGAFYYTEEVQKALNAWWAGGGLPCPATMQSGDYPVRRGMNVIKMCVQIAASRGTKEITMAILEAAWATLFDFEYSTIYITEDLRLSEHGRTMDDAYTFFHSKTVSKEGLVKMFSGQDLRKFLSARVKVYEIEPMIQQMCQAGYIQHKSDLTPEGAKAITVKVQRFAVNPRFRQKKFEE